MDLQRFLHGQHAVARKSGMKRFVVRLHSDRKVPGTCLSERIEVISLPVGCPPKLIDRAARTAQNNLKGSHGY